MKNVLMEHLDCKQIMCNIKEILNKYEIFIIKMLRDMKFILKNTYFSLIIHRSSLFYAYLNVMLPVE